MSSNQRRVLAVARDLGFEIEQGRRHLVIKDPRNGGNVVGILPRNGGNEKGRGHLNVIAQMRRVRRGA